MVRRARPLLGTLVEVGSEEGVGLGRAFAELAAVQAALSRFEPGSDIARFNAQAVGEALRVGPHAQAVLAAAAGLHAQTEGAFDIALGSGRWRPDDTRLVKIDAGTTLDLGGIAKGYAVDCAVAALQAAGSLAGHVNAGGDLRTFGPAGLDLYLRDEGQGGARPLGRLHDGAFATSHYGPGSRSRLHGGRGAHVSVLAPECLWADAFTKLAALGLPLPMALGAQAWVH